MAATAKNIQASYEKIKATPKCSVLVPLILPAITAGTTLPEGEVDWVLSWNHFEKAADDAHLADLIPGAMGKKYTQLYSDQTRMVTEGAISVMQPDVEALEETVAILSDDETMAALAEAEAEPSHVASDFHSTRLPGGLFPESGVVPGAAGILAENPDWPPAHPLPATELPEEVEVVSEGKAENLVPLVTESEASDAGFVPDTNTWFPLAASTLAVLAEVAGEFTSADNVPYAIKGEGIVVKEADEAKVIKLFTHLSEHSDRVTGGKFTTEDVCEACKSVLSELEKGVSVV
jgi:hypothetical protein